MNKGYRGLLLASLVGLSTTCAQAASIHIDMVPGGGPDTTRTVTVGNAFVVDVRLSDVLDLAGFEFEVTYDPAKLSTVSAVSAGIFGLDTFPIVNTVVPGTITFAETTLALTGLNPAAAIVLASLHFTAADVGTSAVNLGNSVLSNSLGSPIGLTGETDGAVTIQPAGPAAVPEPTSAALLGLGTLAFTLRRRIAAGRSRMRRVTGAPAGTRASR